MPNYTLSSSAENDLEVIGDYGDEHYGTQKSNEYRDKLKKKFEELAQQPRLYRCVDYIREGYRQSVCGAHTIYYQVEKSGITIIRILGKQNPQTAFSTLN